MSKSLKPLSSKKPPVPAESHAELEDWIRRTMPDLNPIITYLDQVIRKVHPAAQYAVKWKKAFYGLAGLGWIIEIAAYDVSVNVVFHGGADFDNPPPLGETGRSRYIKLRTLDEAKAPEVTDWIEQAGKIEGWR